MKRIFPASFGAVVIVGMLGAAAWLAWHQAVLPTGTVTLGGNVVVRVTVAATEPTRQRGLSGHAPLAPDEGMLFVFERPKIYAFWMKDMLFPIDILWIKEGAIADITADAPTPVPGEQLPTYSPRTAVDRVLEVPVGFAAAHGLAIGTPVAIRLDNSDGGR